MAAETTPQGSTPTSPEAPRHLIIEAGPYSLHGRLRPASEEGVWETVAARTWRSEPSDCAQTLENAVYDSPGLFEECRTTVLLRPEYTQLVPAALADDEETAAEIMSHFDRAEGHECFVERIAGLDRYRIAYTLPAGMRGFLSRSFPTDDFRHALLPLIEKLSETARAQGGDILWADFSDTSLDVVAFSEGELRLAAIRSFREPSDAAYYLLNAWQAMGFNPRKGEIRVSGNEEVRRTVVPLLRQFVTFVSAAVLATHVKEASRCGVTLASAFV